MSELKVEQGIVLCRDEECDGVAEIEQDGEHVYFECLECGFEFGYQRVGQQEREEACAIGVPESVRRRMSAGMEQAMEAEQRAQPVRIELGRKPDVT